MYQKYVRKFKATNAGKQYRFDRGILLLKSEVKVITESKDLERINEGGAGLEGMVSMVFRAEHLPVWVPFPVKKLFKISYVPSNMKLRENRG